MSDSQTFVYLKRLIKPLVLALLAAATKRVESTWLERWKGRIR